MDQGLPLWALIQPSQDLTSTPPLQTQGHSRTNNKDNTLEQSAVLINNCGMNHQMSLTNLGLAGATWPSNNVTKYLYISFLPERAGRVRTCDFGVWAMRQCVWGQHEDDISGCTLSASVVFKYKLVLRSADGHWGLSCSACRASCLCDRLTKAAASLLSACTAHTWGEETEKAQVLRSQMAAVRSTVRT